LNKTKEVLGVVLPADEDSTLPLDPGEEATQLLIQRIAVVGAITDQILRLGFDHVEVEAQLHQADFMMSSSNRLMLVQIGALHIEK
jgi:hypothetical protein